MATNGCEYKNCYKCVVMSKKKLSDLISELGDASGDDLGNDTGDDMGNDTGDDLIKTFDDAPDDDTPAAPDHRCCSANARLDSGTGSGLGSEPGSELSMEKIRNIITDLLGAIPGGSITDDTLSYSYEEKWTGKYWVDGNKVYQKTVVCGALPNRSEKSVLHGIRNLDQIVDTKAFANSRHPAGPRIINPLPMASTTGSWDILFQATESSLYFRVSGVMNVTSSYVTLQYTCTDR